MGDFKDIDVVVTMATFAFFFGFTVLLGYVPYMATYSVSGFQVKKVHQ